MAPISRQQFHMHFLEQKYYMFIHISQKFVPDGPVDSRSALVHIMSWFQTGNKPLADPIHWLKSVMASLVHNELKDTHTHTQDSSEWSIEDSKAIT